MKAGSHLASHFARAVNRPMFSKMLFLFGFALALGLSSVAQEADQTPTPAASATPVADAGTAQTPPASPSATPEASATPTPVAPSPTPEIRTPAAPATPRINGPSIFGARPGNPFLYHIPATGERPMKFSAKGLPRGLKVDPDSGNITGSLRKAGETVVILRAKNALGV